mmetsp:Transcript_28574/g.66207  ORF Transcript_28574/g.66207 Transcript_28574/m.66207 type:complete len:95 (-) Transcript_28574:145-429(-)
MSLSSRAASHTDHESRSAFATYALEAQSQQLQNHFARAQESIITIARMCDDAEATVQRSQLLLNRSAREMQAIHDRTRRILAARSLPMPQASQQ